MRISLILLGILFSSVPAQNLTFSSSLTAQYGEGILPGIEIGDTSRNPYLYREYYLDITTGYRSFSLWSSFEFSSPPQLGPKYNGLRKLRLSLDGASYAFMAGDIFGIFGRGLTLNFWESQGIDWDSSLRGIWLKKSLSRISFDVLSGTVLSPRHLPPGSPGSNYRKRDFSLDATVRGLMLSGKQFVNGSDIGTYVVNVETNNPWFARERELGPPGGYHVVDSTIIKSESLTPGIWLSYMGNSFDIFIEHARRTHLMNEADSLYSSTLWKTIFYPEKNEGTGTYASISYYPGRLGITFEYKNLAYSSSDPEQRDYLPYYLLRRTPIQSPPTLVREHTSTLLSRKPHPVLFEDEVGFQMEANYSANENLSLLMNVSANSRHTSYEKVTHPDFSLEWKKRGSLKSLWLNSDDEYFPFFDTYGEVNYYFEPLDTDVKVMLSKSSDIIFYNKSIIERAGASAWLSTHSKESLTTEKRNLFSIPTNFSWKMFGGYGMNLSWEHQWEKISNRTYIAYRDTSTALIDSVKTDETTSRTFYNRYISISFGKPNKYSIGFIYDSASSLQNGIVFNENRLDDNLIERFMRYFHIDVVNKWFGAQANVYLSPSTILQVFYGSMQGGLKCDSGVCVYVPGIEDALMITLTSNL